MSLLIEKSHVQQTVATHISGNPDSIELQFFTLGGGLWLEDRNGEGGVSQVSPFLGSPEPQHSEYRGGRPVLDYWAPAHLYTPTTTAWSLSYGSKVSCSWGFMFSCCIFFTSEANTASAEAVESMQLAYREERIWALHRALSCFPFWWSLSQKYVLIRNSSEIQVLEMWPKTALVLSWAFLTIAHPVLQGVFLSCFFPLLGPSLFYWARFFLTFSNKFIHR